MNQPLSLATYTSVVGDNTSVVGSRIRETSYLESNSDFLVQQIRIPNLSKQGYTAVEDQLDLPEKGKRSYAWRLLRTAS